MAKTPAQSARAILHIIVSGGTKANEIIMYGEVERAFLETDSNNTPRVRRGAELCKRPRMAYVSRHSNEINAAWTSGGKIARIVGLPS
jgi:hypothetical protein